MYKAHFVIYCILCCFVLCLAWLEKTNKRNMEEMNTPHSMGSGQQHQHPMNHTRPFFYVQPPSQPYFLYQWHINNSYSHYGFPGSGLSYGRPYLPPYPYMQYPGYVVPQAPMQPMDYRRMFNPHFPSTGTSDLRYRCHQTHMRRETACSEVQTEPSEAVEQLMKCFGKMETCDPGNKELDSGMVSQSSGTCLSSDEQKQFSLCGHTGLLQRSAPLRKKSEEKPPSHKLFNEPTSAELRQDRLDALAHREEWSVSSCEGVLPLDSSSVHEDNVLQNVYSEEHEEQCVPTFPDTNCLSKVEADNGSIRSNWENTFAHDSKSQPEKVIRKGHLQGVEQNCDIASTPTSDSLWTVEPLTSCLPFASCLVYEGVEQDGKSGFKKSIPLLKSPEKKAGDHEIAEKHLPSSEDLKFRIMKLPFYTQEELQKDNPLWSVDSLNSLVPPASWLSTIGNAYYSYYPQAAQERQSVLSASLDELSSRDEMFSTDMEDIDIIPTHVYKGERVDHDTKMQEHADSEDYHNCSLNEECPVCPKKKMCATCGSCLSNEVVKTKVAVPGLDDNEEEEEDDEVIEDEDASEIPKSHEPLKAASLKKIPPPKRSSQPCSAAVQFPKQKSKKGCCEETEGSACHEEHGLGCSDVDEEQKTMAKAEKFKGQEQRNVSQKQMVRLCREGTATTSDQESWESYGARPRNKPLKPYPQPRGRGQERPHRKRPPCKTVVYQRSRRNEYDENEEGEFPRNQRGRGYGKRRGTRY